MWPWEHVIVGYVAYSLCCHIYYRDAPGGLEAIAVVFASVLPDLIDKPLAWEYGVFESGYALGHSIFFAVPLALVVGLLARRIGRPRAGVAFAVGYLVHAPADVLDDYVREGVFRVELLLWPVVRTEGSSTEEGFFEVFSTLLAGYGEELAAGDLSTYVLALLALGVGSVALWLYDGAPPIPESIALTGGFAFRVRTRLLGRDR